MRYRLRTLLILLALAGVLFGRIAYLRQKARTHRRIVAEIAVVISNAEKCSPDHVEVLVSFLAAGGIPLKSEVVEPARVLVIEDSQGRGVITRNCASFSDWKTAVIHEIIAERYERATIRPWLLVSESTS